MKEKVYWRGVWVSIWVIRPPPVPVPEGREFVVVVCVVVAIFGGCCVCERRSEVVRPGAGSNFEVARVVRRDRFVEVRNSAATKNGLIERIARLVDCARLDERNILRYMFVVSC